MLLAGALGMLAAWTLLFMHLRFHTILLAIAAHGLAANAPRAVGVRVHAALLRVRECVLGLRARGIRRAYGRAAADGIRLSLGDAVFHADSQGTAPATAAELRNDFDVATTAGAVAGMLTAGVATGALGVLAGTFSQMALSAAAAYWAVVKLPATGTTAPHEAQPAQVRTRDLWVFLDTTPKRPDWPIDQ